MQRPKRPQGPRPSQPRAQRPGAPKQRFPTPGIPSLIAQQIPRPTFQTPYQDGQDNITDLTDDTAPKVGGWIPLQELPGPSVGSGNPGPSSGDTQQPSGKTRGLKILQQQLMYKKQQAEKGPASGTLSETQGSGNAQQNASEAQREPNKLTDESMDQRNQEVTPLTTIIQQGTAGQIRLTTIHNKPGSNIYAITRTQGDEISRSKVKTQGQHAWMNQQPSVSGQQNTQTPEPTGTVPTPDKNHQQNVSKKQQNSGKRKRILPLMPMPTSGYGIAGIPRSFLLNHQTQQFEYKAILPPEQRLSNTTFGNVTEPLKSIPSLLGKPQTLFVNTNADNPGVRQQYSPSDVYEDISGQMDQEPEEIQDSIDMQAGQKRLSAFQRLGPLTQPKKPKLTISLMYNKEQSVREVVQPEEIVPVHLRQDVIDSSDETVMKYLPFWPWKKPMITRKTVTARQSKSAMLLEQEQMEEVYERDSAFVQVTLKGYPPSWRKEDVMDTLLDAVKGKSFIPCFVEFTREECKFVVIRCKPALVAIHKLGFLIQKDDVVLQVFLHKIDFSLKLLDYLPRLVLRKRLSMGYDSERRLDLNAFTLQQDVSHFIYFPLHRLYNQSELVQLQSTVAWTYLTDLDLSHNKLTTIEGFDLPKTTPRLKNLNVSFNCLPKATALLRCSSLSLKTLRLEGNPLCHDYIDPDHYVKVLRMMFPSLVEIDGTPIRLKGEFPPILQNYCPGDAKQVVDRFLEVFFPLLDLPPDERTKIEDLYDEKATLTVTYKYKMRYSSMSRYIRNLLLRARVLEEGEMDAIEGSNSIVRLLTRWPPMKHDPYTFTVDVMHHCETSTVLRVSGILKLTVESLAEEEHMMSFTRTVVLVTEDGIEYRIQNEMVYWETPSAEYANTAFKINIMRPKRPSLKLESAPDEDLKEKLIDIFMRVTELDRQRSEKCLEAKEWNLKHALEYFTKLLRLDDLSCLQDMTPPVGSY